NSESTGIGGKRRGASELCVALPYVRLSIKVLPQFAGVSLGRRRRWICPLPAIRIALGWPKHTRQILKPWRVRLWRGAGFTAISVFLGLRGGAGPFFREFHI